jgi:transposase-like protein
MAYVIWNDAMVQAIAELRAQGLNVMDIADRLGVSTGAFLRFRKKTGFRMAPIKRSRSDLVGWYQESEAADGG